METAAEISKDALIFEISQVFDPDIGLSLYEMGLIYDISANDAGLVVITMTLTSMACPAGPQMIEELRQAALRVSGVSDCEVNLVWEPRWDPHTMASEDAKMMMGLF